MFFSQQPGLSPNLNSLVIASWILIPFVVVDLVLKAIALWRAAQARHKWWFIGLLVINSLGVLPLIYLLTHKAKSK